MNLEQSTEFQLLYLDFIDFEEALYSVYRYNIWSIVGDYDIPAKLANVIKQIWLEDIDQEDNSMSSFAQYHWYKTGIKDLVEGRKMELMNIWGKSK